MSIGTPRPRFSVLSALLLLLTAFVSPAYPLTDEEVFRAFRFNFINPGAQAMGLGGAYIAAASDATAAATNPAALFFLYEPNFFIEYRGIESRSLESSSCTDPNGCEPRLLTPYEAVFDLNSASETEAVSAPTFVSLAWPITLGSSGSGVRWVIAGSRQLVLSQRTELPTIDGDAGMTVPNATFSFGSYPAVVDPVAGLQTYEVENFVTGESGISIIYYSVANAIQVSEDFTLGLTLTYATLDLQASTTTAVVDPLGQFVDPRHPRIDTPGFSDTDIHVSNTDDTDSAFAYSIGIHWHPDGAFGRQSPLRLGAVYRKGARFEVPATTQVNGVPESTFTNSVPVPDRYGVGVSYRTPVRWMFTVDYERIEYSDLLEDFESGINFLTSDNLIENSFTTTADPPTEYAVDDAHVLRAGLEFGMPFSTGWGMLLRGGYYNAPDSQIRLDSISTTNSAVNNSYLEVFGGGEDFDHFTAGIGFYWKQSILDVAVDFSDEGDQVVASYALRFGKAAHR